VSRRSGTLQISIVQVQSGESILDTMVSQIDRRDGGMGIRHSTNVDLCLVVTQVVEQVAPKLALNLGVSVRSRWNHQRRVIADRTADRQC